MLREFVRDDVLELTNIYNEYINHSVVTFDIVPLTVEQMEEKLQEILLNGPCFVYEHEGQVVGYCYAHPWKTKSAYSATYETTIYLSPQARGYGFGKQLMRQLIESCRSRQVRVLIACITGGNEASIRLHKQLGFVKVSHFVKVGFKMNQWLDVEDYELQLFSN